MAMDVCRITQQERPAISKLRDEHSELMPGIHRSHRLHAICQPVARQQCHCGGHSQRFGLDTQLRTQGALAATRYGWLSDWGCTAR
jgi:hypothetical protein